MKKGKRHLAMFSISLRSRQANLQSNGVCFSSPLSGIWMSYTLEWGRKKRGGKLFFSFLASFTMFDACHFSLAFLSFSLSLSLPLLSNVWNELWKCFSFQDGCSSIQAVCWVRSIEKICISSYFWSNVYLMVPLHIQSSRGPRHCLILFKTRWQKRIHETRVEPAILHAA